MHRGIGDVLKSLLMKAKRKELGGISKRKSIWKVYSYMQSPLSDSMLPEQV